MKFAADTAILSGMPKDQVHVAMDHKQSVELVMSLGKPGSVVLVKGSRTMKMELVASNLAALWNNMDNSKKMEN